MEHTDKKDDIITKNNDTLNDIIAVRFKGNQQYYHFKTGGINVQNGQAVIASTDKGVDVGYVCFTSTKPIEDIPLKTILRKANEADLKTIKENIDLEIKARKLAQDEAKKLKLKMTFQVCKYSLDRKRATLYFTSEKRVDFRELVKNLANILHLRVELWQIGTRDETRLFGGIGPCNRELCCSMFYSSRESVTVKDAKAQGLDINPQKITGMCGKLMCCLKFEVNEYKDKFEKLPSEGEMVKAGDKEGKAIKINPFGEMISIVFEEGNIQTFHASDVKRKIDGKWVDCEFEKKSKEPISTNFFSVSTEDENEVSVVKEREVRKKPKQKFDKNKKSPKQKESKNIELQPEEKPGEKKFSKPEPFQSTKDHHSSKPKHRESKPQSSKPNDRQVGDQNRGEQKKKFGKKPFGNRSGTGNKNHQNKPIDGKKGSTENRGKPGEQKNKSKKVSNINKYLSNRERNKKGDNSNLKKGNNQKSNSSENK